MASKSAAKKGHRKDRIPCDHCHQEVERGSMERHLEECDKVDRPRVQTADHITPKKLSSNEKLKNQLEKELQEQQQYLERQLQEQQQYLERQLQEQKQRNDELLQKYQLLTNKAEQLAKTQQQKVNTTLLVGIVSLLVLLYAVIVGVLYFHSDRVEGECRRNWTEVTTLQQSFQEQLSIKDEQIKELRYELQQSSENLTDNLDQQFRTTIGRSQESFHERLRHELEQSLSRADNESQQLHATIRKFEESFREQISVKDGEMERLRHELQQNLSDNSQNQVTFLHTTINSLQESFQEQELTKDKQIKELKNTMKAKSETINDISLRLGFPPYEITFPFIKESNYQRASGDLYTHYDGYKFGIVLSIKEGAGTYLSVMVRYYDKNAPISKKLSLTLELINQHTDKDHHMRTLQCEIREIERNFLGIAGIKILEFGTTCGDSEFIPYSSLEWNEDKQTQYLKDGCLKVRVSKISIS